jgi:hypothetical protein
MANTRIHIRVIGPKGLETSRAWINFGKAVFDGNLGQARTT